METFHGNFPFLQGIYEPGKRHWLKVKKDYLAEGAMADSADLVVLGAYFGTGNKGRSLISSRHQIMLSFIGRSWLDCYCKVKYVKVKVNDVMVKGKYLMVKGKDVKVVDAVCQFLNPWKKSNFNRLLT